MREFHVRDTTLECPMQDAPQGFRELACPNAPQLQDHWRDPRGSLREMDRPRGSRRLITRHFIVTKLWVQCAMNQAATR